MHPAFEIIMHESVVNRTTSKGRTMMAGLVPLD
jgi:hypothetical protein